MQGEYLDLSFKQIDDITKIEGLEELTKLEALNLRNNQIKDIKGFEKLINLKRLYLNGNKISEIKGLDNLNKLEILHLENNQISEIKGLERLQNLLFLDLSDNRISKIAGLDTLHKLEHINLIGNQMEDPEEEYLILKTNNAQEFVEKCVFQKIDQNIPFIKFDSLMSFQENINAFEEKHRKIEDISFFVSIGTHKEIKQFKSEQNAVFFARRPEEIHLS